MKESPAQFAEWVSPKKPPTTTEWQTKQEVKEDAYQLELEGKSREEVEDYIKYRGFDSFELNYVYTGYPQPSPTR